MKRLVAIIEWNLDGHRLPWFSYYCRACLDLGCQVVALCPEPEKAREYVSSFDEKYCDDARIRFAKLRVSFSPRFVPGRIRRKIRPYLFASHVRDRLKEAERDFGRKTDFFFFSCLLEHEEWYARKLVDTLHIPWSGLNLHARVNPSRNGSNGTHVFSMQSLFESRDLVSVGVIDEEMDLPIAQALNKPVVVMPEISDERYQKNHPFEERFRRFANGSKLVLVPGHLRPNKGIINLAKVAMDPAMSKVAFAFVGEVPWGLFSAKEREFFEYAITHAPSSIFHLNAIPDGPEYNAAIRSCDVLFAAYHDFSHSSNTLSKAAIFQKPLIVSDGYLMAKRVRAYRMGEVIPQNNSEATIQAIERLTQDYPGWEARVKPRWREYEERHSYKALIEAFAKLLSGASK
ncbi:MAG TPA: glycosyltransferase [Verrucomicrobiae bacterium]|jgi:glycosyltransferase involved in cell wall biosynthesis|nr:glycosyltransferase [Verrucomicrobiae bacterium]